MVRHTTGIGAKCGNCGYTSAHYESQDNGAALRCDECGRFCQPSDDYCAEHDLRIDRLPSGYTSCPKCDQRRRVEQERQEMMERRANPRLHNTVDAPRW